MSERPTATHDLVTMFSSSQAPELVRKITARLDEDDQQRFADELLAVLGEMDPVRHQPRRPWHLPARRADHRALFESLDRLMTVIRAWHLSVCLPDHPDWPGQRADAERRWSTPVDSNELAELRAENRELRAGLAAVGSRIDELLAGGQKRPAGRVAETRVVGDGVRDAAG